MEIDDPRGPNNIQLAWYLSDMTAAARETSVMELKLGSCERSRWMAAKIMIQELVRSGWQSGHATV